MDEPIVDYLSLNITLNDDTEKKDTGLNDEIVEKEGNAKVDMPVKERKGLSAKNCETPPKKVQKNKILDQEMHTVDVSNKFDTRMCNFLYIHNPVFSWLVFLIDI